MKYFALFIFVVMSLISGCHRSGPIPRDLSLSTWEDLAKNGLILDARDTSRDKGGIIEGKYIDNNTHGAIIYRVKYNPEQHHEVMEIARKYKVKYYEYLG